VSKEKGMGHVIVILGAFIAFNFGVGDTVASHVYERESAQGVVEVQENPRNQPEM